MINNLTYSKIPSLTEITSLISKLKEYGADVSRIASSEQGNPVLGIRLGKGALRLVVVAGQHGSEPAPVIASILFTYKLLRDELRPKLLRREVLEKTSIIVIPLMNPDGFSKLEECLKLCRAPSWSCECIEARLTAKLEDINRDWLWLKHNATRSAHRLINEIDPHIVLDLHEFYARGGAPPKWAYETEGFNAYVTDTPYLGVSQEITWLSLTLAKRVKNAIESTIGWNTKIIRPGNGLAVYPPIYLGTHAPLEGSAKLLVETWGTGLGPYLLYERVHAHIEAITEAVKLLLEEPKLVEYIKNADREYDKVIGRLFGVKYTIKGRDIGEVKRILSEHSIEYVDRGEHIVVEMPQRYSRTTLFLLDHEYPPNKELVAKNRQVLLDSYLDVEIVKE